MTTDDTADLSEGDPVVIRSTVADKRHEARGTVTNTDAGPDGDATVVRLSETKATVLVHPDGEATTPTGGALGSDATVEYDTERATRRDQLAAHIDKCGYVDESAGDDERAGP